MLNEHNHECHVATDSFACANRRLTEDMNEMIHYFTIYGHLDAGAQMALLKGKFPERYVYANLLLEVQDNMNPTVCFHNGLLQIHSLP